MHESDKIITNNTDISPETLPTEGPPPLPRRDPRINRFIIPHQRSPQDTLDATPTLDADTVDPDAAHLIPPTSASETPLDLDPAVTQALGLSPDIHAALHGLARLRAWREGRKNPVSVSAPRPLDTYTSRHTEPQESEPLAQPDRRFGLAKGIGRIGMLPRLFLVRKGQTKKSGRHHLPDD